MIKSIALLNVLASATLLEPSATSLNWFQNYDLGDIDDDSFSISYGDFDYDGEMASTIYSEKTLSDGLNTISTCISYNPNSLMFSRDYPYVPCYVGYSINGTEYLDFYLLDDSVNTFVVDTSENYVDGSSCYWVFKFPLSLDINHNEIYTANDIYFYSDVCYYGNIFGDTDYLNGYNAGYNYGYHIGNSDGYNEGYSDGYATGEQVGYNEGVATDVTTNGMKTLFNSILSYPVNLLRSVLNFNFMGINVADFVLFLVSVLIVVFVIKFFI